MDLEYNSIDLKKTELQNLRLHNLASAPEDGAEGMMYADTTEHKPKYHNGTGFVDLGGGNSGTTYTFAEGETDGAIEVTPDGGTAQSVPVHGLNNAAYKDVDTSITSGSTSANIPTTEAVTSYVDTETADKVDKVTGKGLSTNDLTDALKSNYDEAYTDKHTHSNKDIIDAIAQTDIDNWNAASESNVKVYHSLAELNITGTVTIATIHAAMEVGSILAAEVSGLSVLYFPAASGMIEGRKYSATQSSFQFHRRISSSSYYDYWFNYNSSYSGITTNYWTQAMTNAERTKLGNLKTADSYSTSVVATDKTWTGGETIYRKVVEFGDLPTTGTKSVAYDLTDPTKIIGFTATAEWITETYPGLINISPLYVHYPADTFTDSLIIRAYLMNGNCVVQTSNSALASIFHNVRFIIEYIK